MFASAIGNLYDNIIIQNNTHMLAQYLQHAHNTRLTPHVDTPPSQFLRPSSLLNSSPPFNSLPSRAQPLSRRGRGLSHECDSRCRAFACLLLAFFHDARSFLLHGPEPKVRMGFSIEGGTVSQLRSQFETSLEEESILAPKAFKVLTKIMEAHVGTKTECEVIS